MSVLDDGTFRGGVGAERPPVPQQVTQEELLTVAWCVAQAARDGGWAPADTADMLRALGADAHPMVARVLEKQALGGQVPA